MSAPRDDRGGRANDPDRIADVREQLEAGSLRFTGENPANSVNVETCPDCGGRGFLHDIATRTAVECFCIEDARRDRGTP